MAITNNNKPLFDLPFFELTNQAPVASSAVSAMTTAEDGSDKFIYYISTSAFYRYDTQGDTWQQLANPNTAPLTIVSMRHTKRRGYHGQIIAATSNTVTIPGLRGEALSGETIRIEFGVGSGQERVITFSKETTHDTGVVTAATGAVLTDTTKKWRVNQWAGYTIGINFGTGATLYKKILYNDATSITLSDANLQPHDPWNNQTIVAASPYAVPAATAGAQSQYSILSTEFTVDTPWTVIPNSASYFTTLTGGIYLVSSAAAAPFYTFQYYDIASDTWQTKTTPQSLYATALATEISLERTGKIGTALVTKLGTTSGTIRTLADTGLSLERDRYRNHRIYITGGTGIGQSRRIVAHTATNFTVARNWDTIPDSTTTYEIWPDYDRIYMSGHSLSSMFAYSPENDYWMQGQAFDDGITNNISAKLGEWNPIGVSTGTRIASGVLAVASTPTAGGSNYVAGDVLTCSVGGTGAQVRVTSISTTGAVTGLELVHVGTATGFATGTGFATTGGTGTGCTIQITQVGSAALITTASAHWYHLDDIIVFAGCTESAWNAAHTVIGVPSTTTFCVATPATANMAATASQSTTVIVDPTKNWITNEHVGRLVHVMVAGTSPTSQIRWITANTATTLTVATITAAVNGTSKYVIYDSKVFGVDEQRKETGMEPFGWASSGSTTTLVDSTKNWQTNQWVGYFFKVEAGTGYGSGRIAITANTATTLTFATQAFTPDATTKYEIADCWGLASSGTTTTIVDTGTKNWTTNQFSGKRFRITGGTGASQELAITSHTNNTLTFGAATAPDATSPYAIIGIPPRGLGTQLIWIWGGTDTDRKARYIYSVRGAGTNQIDRYDITNERWEYGLHHRAQNELFTGGGGYTYDGKDTIYMSRSGTGVPIRILGYNVTKREFTGKGTTTFLQGTTHAGNFLEIVEKDGIEFIYVLQNTGTLMARALLF